MKNTGIDQIIKSNRKIYIDVSNLLTVRFVTGIQRVVRNVLMEFLKTEPERYCLLNYEYGARGFVEVNRELFHEVYSGKKEAEKKELLTKHRVSLDEMRRGELFFDIDSVWNSPCRRSWLLPELKRRGVKTAVYIYDIIPVRYPQFCHINTLHNFLDYIGAWLQHGDLLITSTESVLEDVHRLQRELGVPETKGGFSWLGSDFCAEASEDRVDGKVKECLQGKKYALCVGTIEPRKNLGFVLDAFEKGLFEDDISLVFAGRTGWNVDALKKRIESHPEKGKHFYHFEGLNDESIDWLYRHARVVAFPTYDEGFGLPMIEAFERGTPVICSDRPVLREVGKDLADYFPLNDEEACRTLIRKYASDEGFYKERKENLKNYHRFTWKNTADRILELFETLEPVPRMAKTGVRQMVCLTARPEAVCASLRYVDALMPFIEEVVLCCPDRMAEAMKAGYSGRLNIRILADSDVLQGAPLPQDHQGRNTFLRAQAMRNGGLDDVFIMSDDDYRPLREIDEDFFIRDGRYQAFYCHDIDEWIGTANHMTSYDEGMRRTAAFLSENNFSTKQYSSHMPQVIDRELYLELLERFPGIESRGYDEWSIYFNYLVKEYPDLTEPRPYETLCWPGMGTDWNVKYMPERYSFENYYEELYKDGQIFGGFSESFCEKTAEESEEKIRRYRKHIRQYAACDRLYRDYAAVYELEKGRYPEFGITDADGTLKVLAPDYFPIPRRGFLRIPFFAALNDAGKKEKIQITYGILDSKKELVHGWLRETMDPGTVLFELPVYGFSSRGKYFLSVGVTVGKETDSLVVPMLNVLEEEAED